MFPTCFANLDDAGRRELWATLALRHTPGIGARSCLRLARHFGSAYAAVQAVRDWEQAAISHELAAAFKREVWRVPARAEWDEARTQTGELLLWTDPRYPALLRELPDAPLLLYSEGDPALLASPCLAVVGARNASAEGLRVAGAMAAGLAASGLTVVSGLALGIDSRAHAAALDLPGSTIAVLGTGLGRVYPSRSGELRRDIRAKGLILSEFSPQTRPEAKNFPIRNRLISGLSLGVLVVEAAPRSGSLITAQLATEQNRAVYVIPGSIGEPLSEGCKELIRQGAQAVFSVSDILEDLAARLRDFAPLPAPATPSESSRANALRANAPRADGRRAATVTRPDPDGASSATETAAETATKSEAERGAGTKSRAGATPPLHAKSASGAASASPLDLAVAHVVAPAANTPATPTFDPAVDSAAASTPDHASPEPDASVAEPTPDSDAASKNASPPRRTLPARGGVGERILVALATSSPSDVDGLCRQLVLQPSEISSALIRLEVQGKVRRQGGGYALL